MKLILCYECTDIVSLRMEVKACTCGKSQAVYVVGHKAIYSGPCLPLGIDDASLVSALRKRSGVFDAFVIAETSTNFRRVDDSLKEK